MTRGGILFIEVNYVPARERPTRAGRLFQAPVSFIICDPQKKTVKCQYCILLEVERGQVSTAMKCDQCIHM